MAKLKRFKLWFRKRKKRLLLSFALILAITGTGYGYRDVISAVMISHAAQPVGGEQPLSGADPVQPVDPPPPPPETEEEEIPPLPDPPAGELLEIADGDYLLALVDRRTTLGRYAPDDLVQVEPALVHPAQRQWSYFLRQQAEQALRRMWEAARADGIELLLTSAYRSFETQEILFRDYASRHGEDRANTFSARAGQSEHQLGTAVDFGGTPADHTSAFAETTPGQWLAARAHEFGFALSYPDGAQEITGYVFEPWHFRYIGVESAAEWRDSGLVLSRFLESKPQRWLE
ncbi:MAG: M15 family metallopeptidase [Dethiobacter sp.]|nr:M15 family metallopeptidase [Dethiobacter sp.]